MKITVAIPVYNREKMIVGTMQSAIMQSLPPGIELELLVVDNCSTDATWETIQEFAKSVGDSRLRAIRNDHNLGMFGNFNRCRELATGDYVRYLCSDDFLAPNCLAAEVSALENHPTASVLNTVGVMIDQSGTVLAQAGDFFKEGLIAGKAAIEESLVQLAQSGRNVFNFPSGVLVRKSAADRVGAFDASLLGLADFEYWLQLLCVGDLLVTKSVGCQVVEHPNRGSFPLFYSGSYIGGQLRVVDEWGARIGSKTDRLENAKKSFGARCLWYVFKCVMAGRADGAKIHWRIFRSRHFGFWSSAAGILKEGLRRVSS